MNLQKEAGGYRPLSNATSTSTRLRDERSWRKLVDGLPEDELMHMVRGMVSVDRAVTGFRGRSR